MGYYSVSLIGRTLCATTGRVLGRSIYRRRYFRPCRRGLRGFSGVEGARILLCWWCRRDRGRPNWGRAWRCSLCFIIDAGLCSRGRRWGRRAGAGYSRAGGRGDPESYYRASSFHYRNIKARAHSVAKSEGRSCRILAEAQGRCSLRPSITPCSNRIARLERTPLIFYRKFHPSFGLPLLAPSTNRSPSWCRVSSVLKQVLLDVLKMTKGLMICSITRDCLEHRRNGALLPIASIRVLVGSSPER